MAVISSAVPMLDAVAVSVGVGVSNGLRGNGDGIDLGGYTCCFTGTGAAAALISDNVAFVGELGAAISVPNDDVGVRSATLDPGNCNSRFLLAAGSPQDGGVVDVCGSSTSSELSLEPVTLYFPFLIGDNSSLIVEEPVNDDVDDGCTVPSLIGGVVTDGKESGILLL